MFAGIPALDCSATAASLTLYSSKKSGDSPDAEMFCARMLRYSNSSANLSNSAASCMGRLVRRFAGTMSLHRSLIISMKISFMARRGRAIRVASGAVDPLLDVAADDEGAHLQALTVAYALIHMPAGAARAPGSLSSWRRLRQLTNGLVVPGHGLFAGAPEFFPGARRVLGAAEPLAEMHATELFAQLRA